MKQQFIEKNFRQSSLRLINILNEILDHYREQGLILTVRQLFYQAVARGLIENTEKQYNRIVCLVNNARLGGLVDWDMIEDRTRNFIERTRWRSGAEILKAAADSYHVDLWTEQDYRVFVVIEKDALSAVILPVCNTFDVPLLSARGYPSVSALHSFAQEKIIPAKRDGQQVIVLHLGDHDPSGLDMTNDLKKRLALFTGGPVSVERIALTLSQIEELQPPPNPAKQTDKRFPAYRQKFGDSSWELDALPPDFMAALLGNNIKNYINDVLWQERQGEIDTTKYQLLKFAENFAA